MQDGEKPAQKEETRALVDRVSPDAAVAVMIVIAASAMSLIAYATSWLLGIHSPEAAIMLGIGFALGIVPKYNSVVTLRHVIDLQTKTMNLMEERIGNLELILQITKKKPEREPPGKG